MHNMFRDTNFHVFNSLDSLTVIANSDKAAKICILILSSFVCKSIRYFFTQLVTAMKIDS